MIRASYRGEFDTALRYFQVAACKKALCSKDIIIVAPTESGKTHCFAFLSEIFNLQGKKRRTEEVGASVCNSAANVILVISPLSGLLVELTERLISFGNNVDETIKLSSLNGSVSVLFITPEAVLESKWRKV